MDDRTTIAKELYIGWLRDCWQSKQVVTKEDALLAMARCVQHADDLLAEINRTAKDKTPQSPHPKPPSSWPRWRKMDDVPNKPTHCIMYQYRTHFCVFWDMNKWVWEDNKDKAVNDMRGAYWLDLNGFTPEVGE